MTTPTPSVGDIVYLTSLVLKVAAEAQSTMPDTPNQYSATLGVMGDAGDVDTSALIGKQGPAGTVEFTLREQPTLTANTIITVPQELPVLQDTPTDIGKYFLLDEFDSTGHVSEVWAYIWYGTEYRRVMMGAFGPPGPVPNVDPEIEVIDPTSTSYIETDGGTLAPSWIFHLAVPQGPPALVDALNNFADYNNLISPAYGDVLGFLGVYNDTGAPTWQPVNLDQVLPVPFSVPESAFVAYHGHSQQAPIGSFQIPPQNFDYTPIVWGHIGGQGIMLSSDPFMIGCEVLLGDPATGVQISRGLGNQAGVVNIVPHYSYAKNTAQAITPTNDYAVVTAGTEGVGSTLYFNLWNDGQTGFYNFQPTNAQLFVSLLPINPTIAPLSSVQAPYNSEGTFEAVVTVGHINW